MQLDEAFVAKDNIGPGILPPGIYVAMIHDSELSENKKGTGRLIKLTIKIVDGSYAGLVLFDYINYTHQNPLAQTIGRQRLGQLCESIGVPQAIDTAELHFKPFKIIVDIKREVGMDDRNVIKKYEKAGAAPVAPPISKPIGSAPGTYPSFLDDVPEEKGAGYGQDGNLGSGPDWKPYSPTH